MEPGRRDDPTALAKACAEAMYANDRASQQLGMTITDVAPGRATARMTVTGGMVNGHDICHGGYLFTLADSAFAFACNTYDDVTVAVGADINFIASVTVGTELVATASERSRQGRSGLYDVTVRTADGVLIAEFRGRCRSLRRPILLTSS